MERKIDSTVRSLVGLFMEKENLTEAQATKKAEDYMEKEKPNMKYYVTLMDFKLRDIAGGALVKTPAKYFDSLTQAKIFQLTNILNRLDIPPAEMHHETYTFDEVIDMRNELKDLSEEFPEYVI